MPTATQTYRALEDLSNRYERLRKRFLDFFELASHLLTENSPISGIAFDGHHDENYFNVAFCGQTFQFSYSVFLDQNGASRGAISCFSADQIDPSKRKLVTAFSYSGTGITDIQKPDDIEDQISIDSDAGAAYLVCYCLHKALTK